MINKKVLVGTSFAALAAVAVVGWYLYSQQPSYSSITSYEQCAVAGYPILESYPEQCKLPDGRTFVRNVSIPPGPGGASDAGASFGEAVTLRVGEKAMFSDGLSLTVKEINDSRCPQDMQCIWEGEIGAVISASFNGVPEELHLATVSAKSAASAGHTVVLQSATTENVTLVVAPSSAVTTSGLTGTIHVGPTCPIERVPRDPSCDDKPYASAKVAIRNTAGALIRETTSDAQGSFRASLPPGTYRVSVASSIGRLPVCSEQEVKVASGAFTKMDISCDSGIR